MFLKEPLVPRGRRGGWQGSEEARLREHANRWSRAPSCAPASEDTTAGPLPGRKELPSLRSEQSTLFLVTISQLETTMSGHVGSQNGEEGWIHMEDRDRNHTQCPPFQLRGGNCRVPGVDRDTPRQCTLAVLAGKRAGRPKWKVEAQVMETKCYVSNVTETSGGTLFTARDDRTRDASADKRDCWAPSSSLGGSLPLGESARVHPSGSAMRSGVLSPSDFDWNVRSVLLGHLAGGRGRLAHLLPGPR